MSTRTFRNRRRDQQAADTFSVEMATIWGHRVLTYTDHERDRRRPWASSVQERCLHHKRLLLPLPNKSGRGANHHSHSLPRAVTDKNVVLLIPNRNAEVWGNLRPQQHNSPHGGRCFLKPGIQLIYYFTIRSGPSFSPRLERRHHLVHVDMSALRAERRRDELRQLVHGQVDVGHLGDLDAHEVGVQTPLHGQVAHNHQAPRLRGGGGETGYR